MESRGTVEIGDTKIEYRLYGTGDPVVLIPGGAVDISYYDHLAQALVQAGYRTVAVNPRGMGASKVPGHLPISPWTRLPQTLQGLSKRSTARQHTSSDMPLGVCQRAAWWQTTPPLSAALFYWREEDW